MSGSVISVRWPERRDTDVRWRRTASARPPHQPSPTTLIMNVASWETRSKVLYQLFEPQHFQTTSYSSLMCLLSVPVEGSSHRSQTSGRTVMMNNFYFLNSTCFLYAQHSCLSRGFKVTAAEQEFSISPLLTYCLLLCACSCPCIHLPFPLHPPPLLLSQILFSQILAALTCFSNEMTLTGIT